MRTVLPNGTIGTQFRREPNNRLYSVPRITRENPMAYRSINPFTEELVKDYPSHTAEQVEQALSAADAAFRATLTGAATWTAVLAC